MAEIMLCLVAGVLLYGCHVGKVLCTVARVLLCFCYMAEEMI